MSVVANDTVTSLRRTIAELRQQLDERSAELNEAVKQQSAAADVLQVINQSRGDLVPVFEAVLDKALGLCGPPSAFFEPMMARDCMWPRSAGRRRPMRST